MRMDKSNHEIQCGTPNTHTKIDKREKHENRIKQTVPLAPFPINAIGGEPGPLCCDDLVAMARVSHPIPSRTRP